MLGLVPEHAALCSHGDVIEGVVHHLMGLGMSVDGSLGFAKGSVWALSLSDSTFTAGRYLAPPG